MMETLLHRELPCGLVSRSPKCEEHLFVLVIYYRLNLKLILKVSVLNCTLENG
jgi:hypothetical protein